MTKVIYYLTSKNENPVDDFLNSLSTKQQGKILRILKYVKEYGLVSILPHVKKLIGVPLWEIRILGQDNIRVFYVIPHLDTVLVLHGFIKKSQKTPVKEISLALKRYKDWLFRSRYISE